MHIWYTDVALRVYMWSKGEAHLNIGIIHNPNLWLPVYRLSRLSFFNDCASSVSA